MGRPLCLAKDGSAISHACSIQYYEHTMSSCNGYHVAGVGVDKLNLQQPGHSEINIIIIFVVVVVVVV